MWFLNAIILWVIIAIVGFIINAFVGIYECLEVKEIDEGPHFYAVKTIKLD